MIQAAELNRRAFLQRSSQAALAMSLLGEQIVIGQEAATPKKGQGKADVSDASFASGQVPRLKLELPEEEYNKLRGNPRTYVHGRLIENDKQEYKEVGVKLKGAAGSFRGVDDHPALTLNLNKFNKKQSFHGLTKIHLNNSVQDGSFLHEFICSEIFLSAGVPTARATHARVWLNNRDLGFYGLKEGYDKTFLKRHFTDGTGNLYDGGFCQDLDGNLEKDCGNGPDDKSDLKALIQACREGDAAKRNAILPNVLDIEAFLTFMALELMTCHWDGYCNNRNNYRVYFDPITKKAYFFPHGMDQMFGDTNAPILHTPGAMVSTAVLQNPEWRSRYRDRVSELLKIFAPPDKLLGKIEQKQARIHPVIAAWNKDVANDQANQFRGLKERLVARAKNLEQQNATPEPRPLKFDVRGVAPLTNWYTKAETDDAQHEEINSPDGVKSYSITCGPSGRCVASWRTKVMLANGTYKFLARVKSVDVQSQADGPGSGAGIRISGGQRTNKVEGTSNWQIIEHVIEIGEPIREVELVAELRATRGQIWFDAVFFKLLKAAK